MGRRRTTTGLLSAMALAAPPPAAARLAASYAPRSSSSSADVPAVETARRRRRQLNATDSAGDGAPSAATSGESEAEAEYASRLAALQETLGLSNSTSASSNGRSTDETPGPTSAPLPGCPGPWTNATSYSFGDAVSSSGIVFGCNSAGPHCSSSEPLGAASPDWTDHWSLGGYCSGTYAPTSSPSGAPTGAPTSSPSFDVLADLGGCPAAWANGTAYAEGDAVSTAPGVVFECTGWPAEDCGTDGHEPLDPSSDAWRELWTPTGYCSGTMSPTPAPTETDSPTTEMIKTVRSIEPEEKSCYTLLDAIADDKGLINKDGYFVFVDEMSNGYYTVEEGAKGYSDLPFTVKYSYVTLACQCITMGGRVDCCQGPKAKLDVSGVEDPEDASPQVQAYLDDICVTTSSTITVAPDRGEMPTTARPSSSISPTPAPSVEPTKSPVIEFFEIIPPAKDPETDDGFQITPIGAFGIALGCVAALMFAGAPFYLKKQKELDGEDAGDDDLDAMERDDAAKENEQEITMGDTESCTTAGLTTAVTGSRAGESMPTSPSNQTLASSSSSIPSADAGRQGSAAADYYASHSLLGPGEAEDDEGNSQISSLHGSGESDESNDMDTSESIPLRSRGGGRLLRLIARSV